MPDYKYKGVYSLKPKPGSIALKKQYYCAWLCADGVVVQNLDLKRSSASEPGLVSKPYFMAYFIPEPQIRYVPDKDEHKSFAGKRISDFVPPAETPVGDEAQAKPDDTIVNLDAPISDSDLNAIMEEYKGELKVDDKLVESLRTRFSNAMKSINDPRKRQSAMGSLQMLIDSDEGIQPAHKHVFNDFGITLRKSKLFSLSLRCYTKIITLSPGDENAYFNAARVLYDSGKLSEAEKYLNEALRVQPGFAYALDFLNFIQNKSAMKAIGRSR